MPEGLDIVLRVGRSTQEHGLLTGCRHYVAHHELPWHLQVMSRTDSASADHAVCRNAVGVIGFLSGPDERSMVASLGVPAAVMGVRVLPGIRSAGVLYDNAAIGELAATYAQTNGYRNFALIGSQEQRAVRFEPAIARAHALGLTVRTYDRRSVEFSDGAGKDRDLTEWIVAQPKPLLAFCFQDKEARWFGDLCTKAGLRVPEDVAILGVDDDVWTCEQHRPPLSSIHIPWTLAGYHLARQMHRLLAGNDPDPIRIAPLRVTERASTSSQRPQDEMVERIEQHLDALIESAPKVGDLPGRFGCSRATIFRRFKRVHGITLEAWWLERRLQRATGFLKDSDLAVQEIAVRCGFALADSFRQAFARRFGQSPILYRRLAGTVDQPIRR